MEEKLLIRSLLMATQSTVIPSALPGAALLPSVQGENLTAGRLGRKPAGHRMR